MTQLRPVFLIGIFLVPTITILISLQKYVVTHLPATGRNNTVLFLAGAAHGLTNVHVATSYGLLENAPHLEVHYASFEKRYRQISHVSAVAIGKFPTAHSIIWHELPGPDYLDAVFQRIQNISGMIFAPGLKGINRLAEGMSFHLDPWQQDDYLRLYQHSRDLIVQIDPSTVVLDMTLRPALDATLDLNRRFVMLSPNSLLDTIAPTQPWGKTLWKYPAIGSALPYPIPWKMVPLNIYLQLRFTFAHRFNRLERKARAYFRTKGIKNQEHLFTLKDVPLLTMTMPEAGYPIAAPKSVTECGPILLDVAKVEDQSPDLYQWLSSAPTVLINLGSMLLYDEARAWTMADIIHAILQSTNVHIVWKFSKLGHYDDDFLQPLQRFLDDDRLRVTNWLESEPLSLLQSGQIVLFVHHGGANSYHEAVYSGIPQVIVPLWYDLYDYAQLVEYLGVGIWPGKDTAPAWNPKIISDGIAVALTNHSLRINARKVAESSLKYGGRAAAAAVISDMAMQGHL